MSEIEWNYVHRLKGGFKWRQMWIENDFFPKNKKKIFRFSYEMGSGWERVCELKRTKRQNEKPQKMSSALLRLFFFCHEHIHRYKFLHYYHYFHQCAAVNLVGYLWIALIAMALDLWMNTPFVYWRMWSPYDCMRNMMTHTHTLTTIIGKSPKRRARTSNRTKLYVYTISWLILISNVCIAIFTPMSVYVCVRAYLSLAKICIDWIFNSIFWLLIYVDWFVFGLLVFFLTLCCLAHSFQIGLMRYFSVAGHGRAFCDAKCYTKKEILFSPNALASFLGPILRLVSTLNIYELARSPVDLHFPFCVRSKCRARKIFKYHFPCPKHLNPNSKMHTHSKRGVPYRFGANDVNNDNDENSSNNHTLSNA